MARGKSAGSKITSTKVAIPAEHAFGTSEEIACRDSTAVQMEPTAFSQIGPSDNSGMNLAKADKSAQDRSGSMKFSAFS